MATLYDLSITKGSQFSIQLQAQDENGATINLSGYSLRGLVRQNYGGPVLIDLSPTSATSNLQASGIVNVHLTSLQTSGVPVTEGVYDIEVYISGTSYSDKLIQGYVRIYPEATY